GGGRRGTGAVVIVAALALATEQARVDEPSLDERRTIARILEEAVVHTGGDGEVHVVADEVHQLERSHAKSSDVAHGPIDRRDVGNSFLEDAKRLAVERPRHPVD